MNKYPLSSSPSYLLFKNGSFLLFINFLSRNHYYVSYLIEEQLFCFSCPTHSIETLYFTSTLIYIGLPQKSIQTKTVFFFKEEKETFHSFHGLQLGQQFSATSF